MIKINNLTIQFEEQKIIENFNLTVNQGEFVSLIGRSGCGKSSIIKAIIANDEEVSLATSSIGYMPQDHLLLEWLTVYDNLCLPYKIDKKPLDNARLDKYLATFELTEHQEKYPNDLSGGLHARVALLRAILMGSDLVLLDEPFAKLDAITKHSLQKWFKKIVSEFNLTIILITHDIDEALFFSSKIIVINSPTQTSSFTTTSLNEVDQAQLKTNILKLLDS